jgi:hypothetical protein
MQMPIARVLYTNLFLSGIPFMSKMEPTSLLTDH